MKMICSGFKNGEDSECKLYNCLHAKEHELEKTCIRKCIYGNGVCKPVKEKDAKITVAQAIEVINRAMNEDIGYYDVWKANIAMAFMDSWDRYVKVMKKRYVNRSARHLIANNAAKYFLDLLFKD